MDGQTDRQTGEGSIKELRALEVIAARSGFQGRSSAGPEILHKNKVEHWAEGPARDTLLKEQSPCAESFLAALTSSDIKE